MIWGSKKKGAEGRGGGNLSAADRGQSLPF